MRVATRTVSGGTSGSSAMVCRRRPPRWSPPPWSEKQTLRERRRSLWLAGATLIGIVVVKLFLVELADTGGIARIVSFTGVGILLLIVSYIAPAPARDAEDGGG